MNNTSKACINIIYEYIIKIKSKKKKKIKVANKHYWSILLQENTISVSASKCHVFFNVLHCVFTSNSFT